MNVHKQTNKQSHGLWKSGTKDANSNPPAKSSFEEPEGIKKDIVSIACWLKLVYSCEAVEEEVLIRPYYSTLIFKGKNLILKVKALSINSNW